MELVAVCLFLSVQTHLISPHPPSSVLLQIPAPQLCLNAAVAVVEMAVDEEDSMQERVVAVAAANVAAGIFHRIRMATVVADSQHHRRSVVAEVAMVAVAIETAEHHHRSNSGAIRPAAMGMASRLLFVRTPRLSTTTITTPMENLPRVRDLVNRISAEEVAENLERQRTAMSSHSAHSISMSAH